MYPVRPYRAWGFPAVPLAGPNFLCRYKLVDIRSLNEILAGLRRLGDLVKREARIMPILDDIMDHDLLGPAIRKGRQEGQLKIVRSQIGRRFGTIPDWADQRLTTLSAPEIQDLALRLFDAKTIEELFDR